MNALELNLVGRDRRFLQSDEVGVENEVIRAYRGRRGIREIEKTNSNEGLIQRVRL